MCSKSEAFSSSYFIYIPDISADLLSKPIANIQGVSLKPVPSVKERLLPVKEVNGFALIVVSISCEHR